MSQLPQIPKFFVFRKGMHDDDIPRRKALPAKAVQKIGKIRREMISRNDDINGLSGHFSPRPASICFVMASSASSSSGPSQQMVMESP